MGAHRFVGLNGYILREVSVAQTEILDQGGFLSPSFQYFGALLRKIPFFPFMFGALHCEIPFFPFLFGTLTFLSGASVSFLIKCFIVGR